ncbi:MAG: hypothetical protein ACXVEE_15595 [Polyangiales bacterium]
MSKLVLLLALSTACASPKPIGPDLPVAPKATQSHDGDGLDSDKDGIPDNCDVCPDKPETYNGWGDGDGCPDSSADIHRFRDHPTHTYAAPIDWISFGAGSTSVSPSQLDQIALQLRSDPRVESITCIGQSAKTETLPLPLSQKRAETICDGLSGRGIGKVKIDGSFGVGTRPMRDLEQEKAADPRAMGIVLVMRADGHVIWKWSGTIVLLGETPPVNVEPGPPPGCPALP